MAMTTIPSSTRSRMGISRRGGVPTALPPASPTVPAAQLGLDIPRPKRSTLRPGVVHIADWLPLSRQRELVAEFREWALPPAGLRHPRVPSGHLMTVQSVCLGWHWQPYAYSRTADDTDGAPVKPLPATSSSWPAAAVADTFGAEQARGLRARRGDRQPLRAGRPPRLHQDGEEPSTAPVVTISLGDTCVFRLAGVDRRTGPFTDVELRSGDLLVFGGPNRRIYHGVPKVLDGTARPASACRRAGSASPSARPACDGA